MEKKYPIGGYAPGTYQCHCVTCGAGFIGDKRSHQCEPCAVAEVAKFDALSPAEQEALIKSNAETLKEGMKNWWKPKSSPNYYQPLFDHMLQEHGLTLLESEMNDIIDLVRKMDEREATGESALWVKATKKVPEHLGFWKTPDGFKNDCRFPVKIDGKVYGMGEIYDDRQAGAPEPIYYFVINGEDFYEKEFHRIEWLDEQAPAKDGVDRLQQIQLTDIDASVFTHEDFDYHKRKLIEILKGK